MPPQPSTDQSLRAENAELRARLEDAEEMLRAIRAGEVDALVVEGDAGPQLFTLQDIDAEQNRFRGEMLAQVSDTVIVVDTEERIIFLNAAAERRYGVQAGAMLGRKLDEIFTRHWPSPEQEAAVWVALREHGEWHGEYLQRTHQGRELHVDSSITLLRDSHGEIIGRLSAVRDITARRAAEEEVRYREQLHRVAFDQAPTGMVFAAPDGRFIQVNARMCEITGYSAEELVRMKISDLTHPDDLASDAPLVESFLSGGTPQYENEKRYVCKGGIIRWVAVTARMVTDSAGQPLHTVGVLRDITGRKETEAALQLTNERLTLAVKCSQVVLFQQDLELRYIWHRNPELGLKFSDFIGKRDVDLMDRAADAAVTEGLKREVIRTGVGQRQEVLVHIQGVDRHYDLLVEPQRDAAGLISGVTCAAIDITERKRAETAQRETERDYRALADASLEIPYRMSADWSTMLPFDGREVIASSDRPLTDWGWVDQYLPRDEHARVRQTVSEAIAAKNLFEMEHRILRLDGSTGWVRSRSVPILDENEEVVEWFGAASDITPRKQAVETLAERTELLNGVLEGMTDVIFVKDLNGRILIANAACAAVLGSTPDQVVGKTTEEWCPPDLAAAVRRHDEAVIASGSPVQLEETFLVAGEPRVFLTLKAPLRDGGGRAVGVLGISRDVTDRKRVEEERRLLASIVENSRDFIGISDTLGNLVYGNRAAMELVGVQDLEQVRRSKIIDYFVPEQRQFVAEVVLPAVINNGRWCGELTMQHFVTEATIPVWYDLFRVDDPVTGQPVNFATVTRDLTERKREEKRLRQSEARFRAGIKAVSDIVWTNNAQGQMAGEQAAWGNFTGQDRDSYQGYGWSHAVHADDAQPTINAWNEAVAGKKTFVYEHRVRRSDGQWRLCSIRAVPVLDDRGEIIEWVGVHTDITEQRELQQALQESDRKKDEFLATLAHELRNPLAPIRNGLQIMKLAQVDAGTVEMSRSMMERQVEQMTRLIDDLMDVSRINQGKLQLQKTRMPLADAVRNAVETSRPLIDAQGHELVVDVPPEPIDLDADLTRLSQVFANLLNNAAKYTDRGGRIRLAVERQGSDAVVSVADSGVGIPADMLARVFDMFAQIDGSLEKSQGGLGIGLNIVKRLVEMHGGGITAESGGLGLGSTFTVRLPVVLTVTTDRPDDRNNVPKAKPARRRILVVDDNVDGASSLAMILDIMGNETQTAPDGLEAVAVAEAFKPDVILMDIGMPKLNGHEACRRIREQPWGRNIVIVAQTGWGQEDDKRKSQEAGFDFHMVKPVDPAALEKMLAELS